ncbi:MAG: ATP-binding protein [Candidatus Lernaella stagnicola]|nr:ATP-binding protein [Candidatus Lernaella stagnicola]
MIVVCYGLPGTGKTTVGRALARQLDCPSLGTDVVRRRILPNPTYTFEERAMIYRALFYIIELVHEYGIDVVIDSTFTRNMLRKQIVELAGRIDTPLFFVECQCDRETAISRIRTRFSPESDARAETYDQLMENWDANPYPFLAIDTLQPVEKNIALIKKHITSTLSKR